MQWCGRHADEDSEGGTPLATPETLTTAKATEEVLDDEWDTTYVEEMSWETLCDVIKESSPSEIAILVNKAKAVSVGASPEDGGQVKRSAEGEAKGASGSGRQPGLRQPLLAFASIPYDVLALTLALLPLDLLSAAAGASLTPVDTREWEVLAANYTHLIIDHDDTSATFFEKLSFAAAYEWGRRLPHLRSI
ncbi:unnamed protein product, partial [Vitrella brassicaformis CCMP3155]